MMDATAFVTFGLLNPSNTRAVIASSVFAFVPADALKMLPESEPPPLTILSFNSMIRRCAVLSPMPLILFILATSSAMIAFLISSHVSDESIMRAVAAPTPETPMSRR